MFTPTSYIQHITMIFCAFVTDIKVDACCVVGDNASRNKITVEANVLESKTSTQALHVLV